MRKNQPPDSYEIVKSIDEDFVDLGPSQMKRKITNELKYFLCINIFVVAYFDGMISFFFFLVNKRWRCIKKIITIITKD